jgi:hypothetical protein
MNDLSVFVITPLTPPGGGTKQRLNILNVGEYDQNIKEQVVKFRKADFRG